MAKLTPMLLTQAQQIGARFGLAIEQLEPVVHGSVNSNFTATLSDGERVFLRVCEESDTPSVRENSRLLAHLVAGGVPTPAPFEQLDGSGSVAHHLGKPVMVFPFIAGSWSCQRACTPERLRQVGAALGRIHQVGRSFDAPPPDRFSAARLLQRLEALQQGGPAAYQHNQALQQHCQLLQGWLARLSRRPQAQTPIVIHGDVFRDNVLWQQERDTLAAVLDFESASLGHPAFDLMVTMLAWCFGDTLERPLANALLDGYRSQAAFSDEMRAHCYDEACAAAVRFAITRVTDYELRPRDVVAYKDYRRFIARLNALQDIGAAGFIDWLIND